MRGALKINSSISNFDLRKPLIIELGTSLENVLNRMRETNNNCVLTLSNERLGGILTERDILLKVTGRGYDFQLTTVDEFITPNPEYISLEDPLAYALNKMYIGGFRNVPVINDEMYPVGIISISDIISNIANYFHDEIINFP